MLVEREEPGERAEAGRAGRLDGCAQALDHGVCGRERDACGGVRLLVFRHVPSLSTRAEGRHAHFDGLTDARRYLGRRPGAAPPASAAGAPILLEHALTPVELVALAHQRRARRLQGGDQGVERVERLSTPRLLDEQLQREVASSVAELQADARLE